jgi:ribonucleoside-diphosphate reductase alpha chain
MENLVMKPQQITIDVLAEKYLKGNETTAEELYLRVANGIAQAEKTPELVEKWSALFLQNMRNGAIGAGRIMAAAGTDIKATLANCFVQPVGDCFQGVDDDGLPGIYDALRQAGETMRRGGGVGYNFSAIRPKGALVKGTMSEASGPCSFMDVFDIACKTVESAGSRRGAQMGILAIDHPDVMEFIQAKRTKGRWNNFNVSIGVTEAFMQALENDEDWQLVHKAKPHQPLLNAGCELREDGKWIYKTMKASEMWDVVMQSTYDFAEPGIVFLDTMNRDNNLHYCEKLAATNPCGEQPLPAYGCCDLGPIILPKFVKNAFTKEAFFDFSAFADAIETQVRFLDNVLDVTYWPLEEQRIEAQSKRRVGLGFTGLGNALTMLGEIYNSKNGRDFAEDISRFMRNKAYNASVELAKEKGAFPLFNADEYLKTGTFASRLPLEIQANIRLYGIRNSHLLSIAPTGTVSLAFADNASNGIEPAFSLSYSRKKRLAGGGESYYAVLDHAFRVFVETICTEELRQPLMDAVCAYKTEFKVGDKVFVVKDVLPSSFVNALEMSADDHLAMLEVVQPFIDSAISKTVNIPADYPFEEFKGIYVRAWKAGLKGLATYRPNETLGSVLSVGAPVAEVKVEAIQKVADIDPLKIVFENRPEGDFEAVNSRMEYISDSTGSRSLYLSLSFAKVKGVIDGQDVEIERPLEIFIPSSQSDVPQEWVSSFSRQLSLNARSGFLAKSLQDARQIKSDRGRVRFGFYEKEDGTKVPRFHDSEVGAIAYAIQRILFKRGFLDVDGNQVPARKLAKFVGDVPQEYAKAATEVSLDEKKPSAKVQHGKKCKECNAHAVVKRDGCDFCENCGALGSCG